MFNTKPSTSIRSIRVSVVAVITRLSYSFAWYSSGSVNTLGEKRATAFNYLIATSSGSSESSKTLIVAETQNAIMRIAKTARLIAIKISLNIKQAES